MNKYICTICGYIYNEVEGYPKDGIEPGTLWDDLSADWTCPLCGASKSEFKIQKDVNPSPNEQPIMPDMPDMVDVDYSIGELSAICSNLSKACEKQYLPVETELFNELATYFELRVQREETSDFKQLQVCIQDDLDTSFSLANLIAKDKNDRGAMRSLKWSEQVTRMLNAHINKYETQGAESVEGAKVYVCEICGFLYAGEVCPDICPVCKVPSMKLTQVRREA